jgi:mono/diheme cytochrome c family protein
LKSPSFKAKSDAQIAGIIRSGVKGTSMPAFGKDKISDAAMKDLLAYIRSLK